jgi:hypothetical protein
LGLLFWIWGTWGLYSLPENTSLGRENYKTLLKYHPMPFMAILCSKNFLQGGAPCHSSKQIKDFLRDKKFEMTDWLGNSPDLNPIENCLNYMKEKLKCKDTGSLPKLIREIKILWTTRLLQGVPEEPK